MIGLLPTAYKLLSTLLLHRLRLECEGFLDSDQAGFRQHRGTRDQIIILSEILAQLQEETSPACETRLAAFRDRATIDIYLFED